LLGAGATAIIVGSIVEVHDATNFCLRGWQDNHTLPDATLAS
jgi:hypothetical protein